MGRLAAMSARIDCGLRAMASIGAGSALLLVTVASYDFLHRFVALPRLFGFNAVQLKEMQYWLGGLTFSTTIGWALCVSVAQLPVRKNHSQRAQAISNILSVLLLFLPLSIVLAMTGVSAAMTSFAAREASASMIGFSNVWILKAFIPLLAIGLFLAGFSILLRAIVKLSGPHENANNVGIDVRK